MRCWECRKLVPLPDIVNGKPGDAGSIRRHEAKVELVTSKPGTEIVCDFTCPHCGSTYQMRTTLLSGARDSKQERRSGERGNGWD